MKHSLAVLVGVSVLAACAKDEGPPPPVFNVEAVSATLLPAAPVGSRVTASATFRALSSTNSAIRGVPVTIEVTGGGTLANKPTKTRSGATSIGTWTLGPVAGPQQVRVTIEPFPAIVFTVNAIPAATATLARVSGDNARGPASAPLLQPVTVRAVDAFGNSVPNVTVTWSVAAGGGSLAATTSLTDSLGVARAPDWTLGASGSQRLRAAVGTINTEFNASIQGEPASITVERDAPSTSAAGLPLLQAPTFTVRDAGGAVLSRIPVTISVTGGGGSITNAPAFSGFEAQPVGTWTMGNALGTQNLTISVAGIPSAVLATTSVVGPPAAIEVIEGAGPRALAGTAVATPLRVRVRDVANHAIANTTVTWNVATGTGFLSAFQTQTDANGETTMPSFTVGKTGGPQLIHAAAGAASLDIPVEVQTDYALEVRWLGSLPNAAVQAAFTNAVNRIRATIVGALDPVVFSGNIACANNTAVNETVPGLIIFATVENIDGPGAVLGSAGPCLIRSTNQLTVFGRMRFDSADLDGMITNGTLEAVILHEMLHVIGVGTLWVTKGLRNGTAPTTSPFFTGALAKAACVDDHSGASACGGGVPVEDCVGITGCGAGTINSHWRELVFRTELMTGYVSNTGNPFSKMTIQSLADMGYTVNIATQDPYTVPPPAIMSAGTDLLLSVKLPQPHGPMAEVDRNGRITRRFMDRLPELKDQ